MALHNVSGKAAEDEVVEYLKNRGFKVIDQNWKTRWCEIDVIAKKDDCIYFVEVKYRSSASQGSGFDYITAKKLRQMNLAARSWVEINQWGGEYTLSAAEVSGENFEIEFIDEI
ncbi:MAG TPA: YraN family protein [Candidatus Saccharimonadales bacterium]|nr:YraN family protein [Candidatus Saccharimonadales bacterium]